MQVKCESDGDFTYFLVHVHRGPELWWTWIMTVGAHVPRTHPTVKCWLDGIAPEVDAAVKAGFQPGLG